MTLERASNGIFKLLYPSQSFLALLGRFAAGIAYFDVEPTTEIIASSAGVLPIDMLALLLSRISTLVYLLGGNLRIHDK